MNNMSIMFVGNVFGNNTYALNGYKNTMSILGAKVFSTSSRDGYGIFRNIKEISPDIIIYDFTESNHIIPDTYDGYRFVHVSPSCFDDMGFINRITDKTILFTEVCKKFWTDIPDNTQDSLIYVPFAFDIVNFLRHTPNKTNDICVCSSRDSGGNIIASIISRFSDTKKIAIYDENDIQYCNSLEGLDLTKTKEQCFVDSAVCIDLSNDKYVSNDIFIMAGYCGYPITISSVARDLLRDNIVYAESSFGVLSAIDKILALCGSNDYNNSLIKICQSITKQHTFLNRIHDIVSSASLFDIVDKIEKTIESRSYAYEHKIINIIENRTEELFS